MKLMSKIELGYFGLGAAALAAGDPALGLAGLAGFGLTVALSPLSSRDPEPDPTDTRQLHKPTIRNLDVRPKPDGGAWPVDATERRGDVVVLAVPLLRCLFDGESSSTSPQGEVARWWTTTSDELDEVEVLELKPGEDVFASNGCDLPHREPLSHLTAA